jgi:hypothetical protein
MIFLIAILIIAIIVGANWWFGAWNIMINLINFFIAALVASNYFEVLADQIESFNSTLTYLADFIALWTIFFLTFIVLRAATDSLSRYRMTFEPWFEYTARGVLSAWLSGGFVCFVMFSLHLAPLPPESFQAEVRTKTLGFGPDRMWLAFIQSRSRGALAESKDAMFVPPYDLTQHPDDVGLDLRVFDPRAQFIPTYHRRRANLAQITALRVNKDAQQ